MRYRRFLVMIAVSTIIMFGLMYLNTFAIDHVEHSQTRAWMAILMDAAMAIIIMGFMWDMYRHTSSTSCSWPARSWCSPAVSDWYAVRSKSVMSATCGQ